ncbi:hypothetical protein EST38_g14343, partial [Candolleomyces aberdarensis]
LRLPCLSKACLLDPEGCVPSKKNSKKCVACQESREACNWLSDPTSLNSQLRGFWDYARGPNNASFVNSVYRDMREHWETHRTFKAMADREATRFENSCRFLAQYMHGLAANEDPLAETLLNRDDIAKLLQEFPGASNEELAQVPSLASYLNLPPPPEVQANLPDSQVFLEPSFNDMPVDEAVQRAAEEEEVDEDAVGSEGDPEDDPARELLRRGAQLLAMFDQHKGAGPSRLKPATAPSS